MTIGDNDATSINMSTTGTGRILLHRINNTGVVVLICNSKTKVIVPKFRHMLTLIVFLLNSTDSAVKWLEL